MTTIQSDVYLALSLRERGAYPDHQYKARVVRGMRYAKPGEVVVRVRLKMPRGLFQPCVLGVTCEIPESAGAVSASANVEKSSP